jgi:hypothetical protein
MGAALAAAVMIGGVVTAGPSSAAIAGYAGLNGNLTITAGPAATTVRVTHAGGVITVVDVGTNTSRAFPDRGFTKVTFVGSPRNDVFNAQGLDLTVVALGGGGEDVLTGGNDDDVLRGGSGNDRLLGGPGRDWLSGDSHSDELRGGGDDDVLIAIDAGYTDSMLDNTGQDSFWFDSSGPAGDRVVGHNGADSVNPVVTFSNGADRTLNGDRIPDPALPSSPTDRNAPIGAYYSRSAGRPLFSPIGPRATDVNQGRINDCKTVSALAALAGRNAGGSNWAVRSAMVDFADGTFGVRLGGRYFRVDDDLLYLRGGVLAQAGPGAANSIWVAIAEKAIAYYASPAANPRYWVLTSASSTTTFGGFGSASTGTPLIGEYARSQADLGVKLGNALAAARPVTLSLTPRVSTVRGVHAYTLWGVNRSAGVVTSVVLRNPWGTDGTGNGYNDGTNDGLVTIPLASIWADRIPDANFSPGRVNWGQPIPVG